MTVNHREELLDLYGRFYGEERFAVAFTAGVAGDDAKRVTTPGWDRSPPLASGDYGAGLVGKRGLTRNVAIVLRPSNLIVVECDSERDLALIQSLDLPTTLSVQSSAPYKRHYYFRPDERQEALPYVAFRFESSKVSADSGRYFLAPPSLHPTGATYAFLPDRGPYETDIVELPEDLYRDLIERARRDDHATRHALRVDPEAKVYAGQRRTQIFRYACMMRRWGTPYEALLAECRRWNHERCEPPVADTLVEIQVRGAMKFDGGEELAAAAAGDDLPETRVVLLDAFADTEEPGVDALLGTPDDVLVPEGGDVMLYGDGGAGKTTLAIDLAFHLAAGQQWLDVDVAKPLSVLLIENEGPRPLFRRKLARKRDAWHGGTTGERLHVFEAPWGAFTLAGFSWRERLGEIVRDRDIDLIIAGPLVTIGMTDAGTLQEVRAFTKYLAEVRAIAGRPAAFLLIHHENKGGKVSGAWEGAGDTMLHLSGQGHGASRLYVQKARWAPKRHATSLQLLWSDGASFALAGAPTARPERVWDDIADYVLAHGGTTWTAVRDAVGGDPGYATRRRDAMLSADDGPPLLYNASTAPGRFLLWHRDDPARPLTTSENGARPNQQP